jgi:hypothetical protein
LGTIVYTLIHIVYVSDIRVQTHPYCVCGCTCILLLHRCLLGTIVYTLIHIVYVRKNIPIVYVCVHTCSLRCSCILISKRRYIYIHAHTCTYTFMYTYTHRKQAKSERSHGGGNCTFMRAHASATSSRCYGQVILSNALLHTLLHTLPTLPRTPGAHTHTHTHTHTHLAQTTRLSRKLEGTRSRVARTRADCS